MSGFPDHTVCSCSPIIQMTLLCQFPPVQNRKRLQKIKRRTSTKKNKNIYILGAYILHWSVCAPRCIPLGWILARCLILSTVKARSCTSSWTRSRTVPVTRRVPDTMRPLGVERKACSFLKGCSNFACNERQHRAGVALCVWTSFFLPDEIVARHCACARKTPGWMEEGAFDIWEAFWLTGGSQQCLPMFGTLHTVILDEPLNHIWDLFVVIIIGYILFFWSMHRNVITPHYQVSHRPTFKKRKYVNHLSLTKYWM